MIKLKDIEISDLNIRDTSVTDEAIESLEESITSKGLLSRLILKKEKDKIELVAGSRRLHALRDIRGEDGEIADTEYIFLDNLSEIDLFCVSLDENIKRRNLSPFELCKAALWLNSHGKKDKEIAEILGVTPHRLKRLSQLNADKKNMIPEIREELKKNNGLLNDMHWDKMREVEDKDIIKDVYQQIVDKELPPREVPQIISAIQKAKKAEDQTATGEAPVGDGAPEDVGGPIVYSHKGDLVLIEEKGKMKFQVIGKGEDREVPVDQYLEYLRHPDKFKCRVKLELKFIPIE